MKLNFTNERVLAVVAHPDDAELLCSGTLARAKQDGVTIGICVLCRGDKGQPSGKIKNLAAVRRREMKSASRLLGAELFVVGFADGTVIDDETSRRRLIEIFRKFRPTLVLGHSTNDYHPDHQAAGRLTESASWFCASRGHKTVSAPLDASPKLWWMDHLNMSGFDPGFYIDVSDFVELKEQMLACHKSQMQRKQDRDFVPLMDMMRQQQQTRGSQAGVAAAEAFRLHLAFKRTPAW